jgi:hypothetical protein
MSETTAHEALADFLHNVAAPRLAALSFVFHVANESAGGPKARNGVPLDVLKEARMGTRAGVWDFLYIGSNMLPIGEMGAYYWHGLAIELKSAAAFRKRDQGLSDDQKLWRGHYIKHGWYTAVYPEQDWTDAARLFVRWVGGNVEDFEF